MHLRPLRGRKQRRDSVLILSHLVDVVLLLCVQLRELSDAKASAEARARTAGAPTSRRDALFRILKQAIVRCGLITNGGRQLVGSSILGASGYAEGRPHVVWLLLFAHLAGPLAYGREVSLTCAGPTAAATAEPVCRLPFRLGEGKSGRLHAWPQRWLDPLPALATWGLLRLLRCLRFEIVDGLTQRALLALIVVHRLLAAQVG